MEDNLHLQRGPTTEIVVEDIITATKPPNTKGRRNHQKTRSPQRQSRPSHRKQGREPEKVARSTQCHHHKEPELARIHHNPKP